MDRCFSLDFLTPETDKLKYGQCKRQKSTTGSIERPNYCCVVLEKVCGVVREKLRGVVYGVVWERVWDAVREVDSVTNYEILRSVQI